MQTSVENYYEEISDSLINTFDEMVSYETLWAIDGMTEKKLSDLFKQYNTLPSQVLKHEFSPLLGDPKIELLKSNVKKFLMDKIGDFSVCVNGDFQYPCSLRKALHPIEIFYYKGNLDFLNTRSVSVVGARKVSSDGLLRTEKITRELVKHDFTIVSGLAAGVDRKAHETAIKNKGVTIGVVGTPIDHFYPKENKEIQKKIEKDYLLISQIPFYRHSVESFLAHKNNFPRRNVTMAAISEATIIVEASDTSGSLTQARACIQQGKKLFILDSCFNNKSITWPKKYLERGAIRVQSFNDIIDNLQAK